MLLPEFDLVTTYIENDTITPFKLGDELDTYKQTEALGTWAGMYTTVINLKIKKSTPSPLRATPTSLKRSTSACPHITPTRFLPTSFMC
jgi:hypothetical protein